MGLTFITKYLGCPCREYHCSQGLSKLLMTQVELACSSLNHVKTYSPTVLYHSLQGISYQYNSIVKNTSIQIIFYTWAREREKGMKANCYKIVIIFIPRYCCKRSQVHLMNIRGYRGYFCERDLLPATRLDKTKHFVLFKILTFQGVLLKITWSFHNGQLYVAIIPWGGGASLF